MEQSEWAWQALVSMKTESSSVLISAHSKFDISELHASFAALEQQPIIMNFYDWKVNAFHNNLNKASMPFHDVARIESQLNMLPLLPEKQAPFFLWRLFNIFPPRMSAISRVRRRIFPLWIKMCFLISKAFLCLNLRNFFFSASLVRGRKKVEILQILFHHLLLIGSWSGCNVD